jgi:hypothetical protein
MGIKVTGLREAIEGLRGMQGRLRDARPLTQIIATKVLDATKASIVGARSPAGSPWAPLAAATVKSKGSSSFGIEPLLGSLEAYWDEQSALVRSSTKPIATRSPALQRAPELLGIWYGSGTSGGMGTQPARPYIPASGGELEPELAAEIVEAAVDFIAGDLA